MSLPLDVALRQCDRHASILLEALTQTPFPLTEASIQKPSVELTRLLDQFVLRFTKLQKRLRVPVG